MKLYNRNFEENGKTYRAIGIIHYFRSKGRPAVLSITGDLNIYWKPSYKVVETDNSIGRDFSFLFLQIAHVVFK